MEQTLRNTTDEEAAIMLRLAKEGVPAYDLDRRVAQELATKVPPSSQERLTETLKATGIPALEIKCYGCQVMITAACLDSANRWATVLAKFCSSVKKPSPGYDDKFSADGAQVGYGKVFRIWGTI